jgi:hypothetical protein
MVGMSFRSRGGFGRHRLGAPGLYHCSELVEVRDRLTGNRRPDGTPLHRRPDHRDTRTSVVATVGAAILLGAITVGGWLTATGASAMAGMIGR